MISQKSLYRLFTYSTKMFIESSVRRQRHPAPEEHLADLPVALGRGLAATEEPDFGSPVRLMSMTEWQLSGVTDTRHATQVNLYP
ncbi:hypothetical protein [Streptosporangium sp. NPDC002721]|uniref:hypothetical protein n=1 Tax=Streptosporangium sp. NPDC002721 TaxID=3366188 RepID=UPI003674C260